MNRLEGTLARLALCIALLLAPMGGACGSYAHAHRGFLATEYAPAAATTTAAPRLLALPRSWRTISIGKVAMEGPVDDSTAEAQSELGGALPLDARELRAALRDALRVSGAFDAVNLSEDEAPGALADGFILETSCGPASLRRIEEEDADVAPFALWWFVGVAADWVHSRTYEVALAPTFDIKGRRSGARVLEAHGTAGRSRDALSFFERRDGAAPVVATFFGVPPMALDSTPAAVTRALAPEAWRAPVSAVIARVERLRFVARVADPTVHANSKVSANFLAPAVGTILLPSTASEVRLRVALRPGGEASLQKVIVGDQEMAASGSLFDTPVKGVVLAPERPVPVRVVLSSGETIPVLELRARSEIASDGK